MTRKYFVLSTEALGNRMWFAGTHPPDNGMGYQVCLCTVIFDAFEFDTEEAAKRGLEELELSGFEIVPCEFGMSPALARGVKKSQARKRGSAQ